MPNVIRDPFHRALASLIEERLVDLKENLAHGSAKVITEDMVTVTEKYAAAVAQIVTYESVLELCHAIESDQETVGPRPANVKVVER